MSKMIMSTIKDDKNVKEIISYSLTDNKLIIND